jgi:hypothetical protein
MDVNLHDILFNFALRDKLNKGICLFIAALHLRYVRVFHNEHSFYLLKINVREYRRCNKK